MIFSFFLSLWTIFHFIATNRDNTIIPNKIVRLTLQIPITNRRIQRNSFSVKISFQPFGEIGVTTSLPHPQAHLCIATLCSIEIYKIPSSKFSGICSINLCIKYFICHKIRVICTISEIMESLDSMIKPLYFSILSRLYLH